MKLKWQWFLGGKIMFWVLIILFVLAILGFITLYIIDPTSMRYLKVQNLDSNSIKTISEKYVNDLNIQVDRKIIYRFVEYKCCKYDDEGIEMIILGTFHIWNDTYYIDISKDIYNTDELEEVVIHETRHMLVEYLKEQDIINLTKYTEEIAQNNNIHYNQLFDNGIYLLKKENENG